MMLHVMLLQLTQIPFVSFLYSTSQDFTLKAVDRVTLMLLIYWRRLVEERDVMLTKGAFTIALSDVKSGQILQ